MTLDEYIAGLDVKINGLDFCFMVVREQLQKLGLRRLAICYLKKRQYRLLPMDLIDS